MDFDNVEEFKLSIECDYHPTDPSNLTPQYFFFNPNASNVSSIAVKWCEKNSESDSNLDDLIATKERYLYQLIPWLLEKTRNNTNNVCENIKSCINNVWKDTSSNITVGSFVELTNGSEIDMACKIGVVVGQEEQKMQYDFEWELHKYLNTKFKPLDLDIVLMESPVSPRRYRETVISCYDAEPIDLTKYWKNKGNNDDANISNQSFVVRYLLLRDYLRAAREEMLNQKLYRATHTALQTLNKQLEIAVDRADSMLQRRFVGDLKTVSIAFCSNLWVFYYTPRLKMLNIIEKIRGYIHKVNLQRDRSGKYPSLGNNVILRKKIDPDVSTLSDGYILAGDDLQVVFSEYSLKLRLKFVVTERRIPCPRR